MADARTTRLRRLAAAARREAAFTRAAVRAYNQLFAAVKELLAGASYNTDVLDTRLPAWREAVDTELAPEVTASYIKGLTDMARKGATVDAQAHALAYLDRVHNRLVGIADPVFDAIRADLKDGVAKGEGIPKLAARVDVLLGDAPRWKNRARTIARTETIGAANHGSREGARATAVALDADADQVIKQWLATDDDRTRPEHAEADGTQVLGLDTDFDVDGGTSVPDAPNCRCAVLYLFPGDLEYPDDTSGLTAGGTMPTPLPAPQLLTWAHAKALAAGATLPPVTQAEVDAAEGSPVMHGFLSSLRTQQLAAETDPEDEDRTSTVIVAVPAADDPVHGIGEEEKHATLIFLGDLAPADVTAVQEAVAGFIDGDGADLEAFTETVTGVESLGPDDVVEKARVWMLDSGQLADLFTQLRDLPTIRPLYDAQDQWPDYTPHTTIGYPAQGQTELAPDVEAAAAAVEQITYDRLAVWSGDQRTDYPLVAPSTDDTQEPAVTAAAPETDQPGTEAVDAETDTALTWAGVLAPEGVATGDKRKFAEGSIQWMVSPVVLKAMFADRPGHDDSVPVGLILGVERVDGLLVAHGTWDTSDNAVEARRQNIAGLLRGVSVDLDDAEVHLEDADGNAIEGDDLWDMALDEEPTLVVDKARLRAATLWCTPAYVDAYVLDSTVADQVPDTSLVGAEGDSPLGLAAAALYASAGAPAATTTAAPAAAFANPGLTEPTCLTVTDDGRVFGHLATWGTCHIGISGACVTPPTSESDYAHFATGVYMTSDGEAIPVGAITMGTGHADLSLGFRATVDHYDDTGTAAAYINIGEDAVGIWFAGALDESLPKAQRLALQRTGSVSGDWRTIAGELDLVAALAVNVPGFPIPKVRSRVASAGVGATALVASGVVEHHEVTAAHALDYRLLAREVAAYQARQDRLHAGRARFRKSRQHLLAGRIRRG